MAGEKSPGSRGGTPKNQAAAAAAAPRSGAGQAVLRQAGGARTHATAAPPPPRACASCPSSSGMLLPLLRSSCFPSSSPGGGGGGGGERALGSQPAEQLQRGVELGAEAEGARGGGGRWAEREPYACMDPGAALQRRAAGGGGGGGGGLAVGSPALSGGQARRRKQPPRPADFKLQVIIIGSRGVGKTSLMERFTDDTFCEACKSTVGKGACGGRPPGRGPGGSLAWKPGVREGVPTAAGRYPPPGIFRWASLGRPGLRPGRGRVLDPSGRPGNAGWGKTLALSSREELPTPARARPRRKAWSRVLEQEAAGPGAS